MPELPDVAVYVEALERRVVGHRLEEIRLNSPFVLRTVVPPVAEAQGRRVTGVRRLGKRIVIALEGEIFLVLHLMIAGRLRWLARGIRPPARITLATFAFDTGVLAFTEAGTRKRASLHLVQGPAAPDKYVVAEELIDQKVPCKLPCVDIGDGCQNLARSFAQHK